LKRALDSIEIADVSLMHDHAMQNVLETPRVAFPPKKNMNFIVVSQQRANEIGSDESRTAGNEHALQGETRVAVTT